MIFDNVTDITIPQGNVVKIHETNSGRVLWEKLCPQWTVIPVKDIIGGDNSRNGKIFWIAYAPVLGPWVFLLLSYDGTTFSLERNIHISGVLSKTTRVKLGDSNSWGYTFSSVPNQKLGGEYTVKIPAGLANASSSNHFLLYEYSHIYDTKSDPSNPNSPMLLSTKYRFRWLPYSGNGRSLINTKPPVYNDGEVYITHSPERKEYLITGIQGGTFTVPETAPTPTNYPYGFDFTFTQNGQNLGQTIWVSTHNRYYGITAKDTYVQKSENGYTWQQAQVFTNGNVSGITYLGQKNLLCAINSSQNQIATSSDGITWTKQNVPFTNALLCAYSEENDVFCVVNSKEAYVSRDLSNWIRIPLPDNITVNFHCFLYTLCGVFIGCAMEDEYLYVLSLHSVNIE